MENSGLQCSYDYLEIFDGKNESARNFGRWCGRRRHFLLYSSSDRWGWWRHDMETRPVLLALCEGNPSITDSPKKPVFMSLLISLNKLFNEESNFRWFETKWRLYYIITTKIMAIFIQSLICCHFFQFAFDGCDRWYRGQVWVSGDVPNHRTG